MVAKKKTAAKKSPKPTSTRAINVTDNRAYGRYEDMKDAKAKRNKPKKKSSNRLNPTIVRGASAGSQSKRSKKRK